MSGRVETVLLSAAFSVDIKREKYDKNLKIDSSFT